MGSFLSNQELPPLPPLESVPVLANDLSEDLRRLLLESLPSSRSSLCSLGFEELKDYPDCPEHSYLEGYFHARSDCGQKVVESIHPRYGVPLDRSAAPLPLMAFADLMRQKNQPLFDKVRTSFERRRTSAAGSHVLARVLQENRHLADLACQIHWGQAVVGKNLGWHIDGPNSFLHLALGLHGNRALHSKLEYPESDWDNRVVAVQFRLLLLPEELYGGSIDTDSNGSLAKDVFQHLARGQLQVPTVEDVERWIQLHHPSC